MPRVKRSRAGRKAMDPADRRAYARPAPLSKATRLELAGRDDEEAMLRRLEESWNAAPPGGTKRERVCRTGSE